MAKKQTAPKQEEQGTELALFPKLNLPTVTHITEEMNASFKTMYTRLEEDIAHLPTDMTDPKNRAAVASYAYRIARTKTALDAAAQDVSSEAKQIVDAVNDERRQLRTTLDSLKDKARAPLDAWEAEERDKKQRTQQKLDAFRDNYSRLFSATAEEIRNAAAETAMEIYCEAIFGEEGAAEIERQRQEHVAELRALARARQKQEDEAAELEQLRKEKVEREAAEAARKAEEERKQREADEGRRQEEERARIAQEAAEAAKREAAEAIEREKREREAAEQRAKEAEEREAKRIEDEKRREIEQEEARKEAAARAEADAKRREEDAAERERQRIAKAKEAEEEAARQREADITHRKKINGAAMLAIVKASEISEDQAKMIIVAIAKGQIPHVSIAY